MLGNWLMHFDFWCNACERDLDTMLALWIKTCEV
jgi:hypothetical protein